MKHSNRLLPFIIFVLYSILWSNLARATEPSQTVLSVDPKLEETILDGDWKSALKILDSKKLDHLNPVERFIKGHACLAVNRNNESVVLLRDYGIAEETAAWASWTEALVKRHLDSASALYLSADALARQGSHERAIEVFSEALAKHRGDALALNARGVCYASMQKWDEALVDFDNASRAKPKFADSYANRGDLDVCCSAGAEGALAAFEKALKISSDFNLAKIGKASALYALGRFPESEKLLQECQKDPASLFLATSNLMVVRDAAAKTALLVIADRSKGATINQQNQLAAIGRNIQASATQLNNMNSQMLMGMPAQKVADLGNDINFAAAGMQAGANVFKAAGAIESGILTRNMSSIGSGVQQIASMTAEIGKNIGGIGQNAMAVQSLQQQNMANLTRASQAVGPGGIDTVQLGETLVDKGPWKVLARFALQYPVMPQAAAGK